MRRLASTLAWIALAASPWFLISWHADGAVSIAKKKTTAKKKSRVPKAPPVSAKARATANDDVTGWIDRTAGMPIENPAAMVPFFEQLRRLKSGESTGPLSILHYGDSHTAADDGTGSLRFL